MTQPWWIKTAGMQLAQGDMLDGCMMPVFVEPPVPGEDDEPVDQEVKVARLIVVTQSCDLENGKVEFVALCPVHTLPEFEVTNPKFKTKGRWEDVRKGRQEGLFLLASPANPDCNRDAYVVDFGHIVSVPFYYLANHAESLGDRWRLNSPFLEHFSQAFARFFMRVGLPSAIPSFK